jgi:hypothetical protein
MNLYEFTRSRPTVSTDPTGEWTYVETAEIIKALAPDFWRWFRDRRNGDIRQFLVKGKGWPLEPSLNQFTRVRIETGRIRGPSGHFEYPVVEMSDVFTDLEAAMTFLEITGSGDVFDLWLKDRVAAGVSIQLFDQHKMADPLELGRDFVKFVKNNATGIGLTAGGSFVAVLSFVPGVGLVLGMNDALEGRWASAAFQLAPYAGTALYAAIKVGGKVFKLVRGSKGLPRATPGGSGCVRNRSVNVSGRPRKSASAKIGPVPQGCAHGFGGRAPLGCAHGFGGRRPAVFALSPTGRE